MWWHGFLSMPCWRRRHGSKRFVQAWLELLIYTPDSIDSVVKTLAAEGNFDNKINRLRSVLEAILTDRSVSGSDIDAVIKRLNEVSQVKDGRNKYVHALVLEDPQTKEVFAGLEERREFLMAERLESSSNRQKGGERPQRDERLFSLAVTPRQCALKPKSLPFQSV
jgi:hypothetical protein